MLRFAMTLALAMAALCSAASAATQDDEVNFYVSPTGSDAAAGTYPDTPFATPARGLRAIADARKAGWTGKAHLHLAAGDYVLDKPLAIGSQHCGAGEKETWIWGADGPVPTRLLGGAKLTGFRPLAKDSPLRKRIPEAVADKLVQVNLRALGIKQTAPLVQCGFGISRKAGHSQLYVNSQPMPLAGWPNDGKYARLVAGVDARTFRSADNRPARWATTDGAWAYGYWNKDWADSYHPISAYDANARTVTLGGARPPAYGFRRGQRYRYLNVPEELDAPGEWWIDRERGVLVMVPPAGVDLATADVLLSQLGETMVTMKDTHDVHVRDVIIEAGRAGGVRIEGGKNNDVNYCILRSLGKEAVVADGGRDNIVFGCVLYNLAEGGIVLSGGDRKTLTFGNLFAMQCDIHDFGQWCKTYRPAVKLAGVGQGVVMCHIHHAPHAGILLSGNEHVIQNCEIDHVALDTGDVGAIYFGRDWTIRGTKVVGNHFHDIGGVGMGAMGVYNDDCAGGTTIEGNLFERVSRAVMIGGGRDIHATGNIFVDCSPAVHIDARGLTWGKRINPKKNPSWDLVRKLKAAGYDKPPWSTKYPKLATILENNPWAPLGNEFAGNIVLGGRLLDIQKQARPYFHEKGNLVIAKPTDTRQEAILAEPAKYLKGFKPLTKNVGPDMKSLRKNLPGGQTE